MRHHLLAATVPVASTTTTAKLFTGFHPGPAYFAVWVIAIGLVTACIVYVVRLLKRQRRVREERESENQSTGPGGPRRTAANADRDE